jgi:hypothetical protein
LRGGLDWQISRDAADEIRRSASIRQCLPEKRIIPYEKGWRAVLFMAILRDGPPMAASQDEGFARGAILNPHDEVAAKPRVSNHETDI